MLSQVSSRRSPGRCSFELVPARRSDPFAPRLKQSWRSPRCQFLQHNSLQSYTIRRLQTFARMYVRETQFRSTVGVLLVRRCSGRFRKLAIGVQLPVSPVTTDFIFGIQAICNSIAVFLHWQALSQFSSTAKARTCSQGRTFVRVNRRLFCKRKGTNKCDQWHGK